MLLWNSVIYREARSEIHLAGSGASGGGAIAVCAGHLRNATLTDYRELESPRRLVTHQVLICAGSRVTLGKDVDIVPGVYIGTETHEIDSQGPQSAGTSINRDVVVQDGVWLGAGCIVLPGVTVGMKSVIAAGAVVTEDIPAQVIAARVPARVIKPWELSRWLESPRGSPPVRFHKCMREGERVTQCC
jgi:hypothetical protein